MTQGTREGDNNNLFNLNLKMMKPKEKKANLIQYIKELLLAGNLKYEIVKKLRKEGLPEMGEEMNEYFKNISTNTLSNYICEAYDDCQIENDGEAQAQRELMYERFLNLYKEARDRHDLANARQILDSLSKLLGLNEADKIKVET